MQVSLNVQDKEILLDALIDSGASANFLDRRVSKSYSLRTEKVQRSLTLADGSTTQANDQIAGVETVVMGSDGTTSVTTNKFLVMNLQYDCILGLPWMEVSFPKIDWKTRFVSFNQRTNVAAIQLDDVPKEYHHFSKVFETSASDALPPHREYDMKINLKDETVKPTYSSIYQLSLKEQKELKDWIKENLAKNFIRKSTSPYAAPIFFVPKQDGSLRPCIDYRSLNQNTVLDKHPLPLITQLFDQLSSAKYFTLLDLRGAYNLVRIKEGDEYKAAFRCKDGHFEPLVMQFGLTNAPAVFQRFMNNIFQDLLDENVIIYLDDILIFSSDLETHKKHVAEVFRRLEQNNLTVKASKCKFHRKKVKFLGFIISDEGLKMDQEKTEAIKNFPVPQTLKELRSFLGLTNFYRQFIQNYAQKAKPLTDLTRKSNKKFTFNADAVVAFEDLKDALVNDVLLPFPDYMKKFYLSCDASDHTIGAVLSQKDNNGYIRPVGLAIVGSCCKPNAIIQFMIVSY